MYVLVRKKQDLLSKSLERSTRGIVTDARQRKPLLFKQTLRSRFALSRVYKSWLFQTIKRVFLDCLQPAVFCMDHFHDR